MSSVNERPAAAPSTTRRRFLTASGAALAGAVSRGAVPKAQTPVLLPSWVADVDGNGAVTPADRNLAESALFAQRGFRLQPARGFDPRVDVFGRGVVDTEAVMAVGHSVQHYAAGAPVRSRPITIAWHYGWYKSLVRPPALQTSRFKGGNYLSGDPAVETTFNELKNEFGVTVDALSWIPARDPDNYDNQGNYRRGYLQAPNVGTRHVCLIYENTIANLQNTYSPTGRLDFQRRDAITPMRNDFEMMARFLAEVRDESPARIFMLDSRPVIFIFGSHTWGPVPPNSVAYEAIAQTLSEFRDRFRDIYGAHPYLVGDELFLSPTGHYSQDRVWRAANFDAIYVYHHAALKPTPVSRTVPVTDRYIENQLTILRANYAEMRSLRNVFTGQRITVIPNVSPGFSKPGFATLQIGRGAYTDFIKLMRDIHLTEYLETEWRDTLGTPQLPAPTYIVGSWNEEFEGHSIFPFDFNLTVPESVQHGFDLSMAVKEAFGWNHYASRDILPRQDAQNLRSSMNWR